jgi:hypothetical protein
MDRLEYPTNGKQAPLVTSWTHAYAGAMVHIPDENDPAPLAGTAPSETPVEHGTDSPRSADPSSAERRSIFIKHLADIFLPPSSGLATQHGKATSVAVVQDLDDFGGLVAESEVALVHDEGSREGVDDAEQRGDGGCAAGEDGLVADGAYGLEEPALARAKVPAHAQVGQLVEGVVHPGQKDVVRGYLLEQGAHVHVAVDEGLDLRNEVRLRAVGHWLGWELDDPMPEQVVCCRIRPPILATNFDDPRPNPRLLLEHAEGRRAVDGRDHHLRDGVVGKDCGGDGRRPRVCLSWLALPHPMGASISSEDAVPCRTRQ